MNDTDAAPEKIVSNVTKIHIVKPGENLRGLATRFYDDESYAADLARVNGVAESAILMAGRRLKIPPVDKLRFAPAVRLGDVSSPIIGEITATAVVPWYLNKSVWIASAAAFALAWFLTGKQAKKLLS